jgi:hypothetical protein
MMRRAAALLLLLAFPALASVTSSSLTGTVVIGGAPAPGVTVTAASPALQQPRTTTTNARGRYWLGALPPGVYDVTFSLAAHTTLTKRAVLELGRVARADGTLEPNPDEDSTTSTATAVSVADTLAITTHFDDRALDRMPYGRLGTAGLAPGDSFASMLDGVPSGTVTSEETIEQVTVVRGAAPAEWETSAGTVDAFRTRSGGDDFFFSLRDTVTSTDWVTWEGFPGTPTPLANDGVSHFGEATAGGRILPQRLCFFAGAWRGEQAYPSPQEFDGFLAKLDAQLGAAHHLGLSYRDSTQSFGFVPVSSATAALHYTAAAGARFTSEVVAARTETAADVVSDTTDFLSARASYHLGDHVVTAGLSHNEGAGNQASFYASDRWSFSRWNVYAGVRHDDTEFVDRWSPRVAVSYDLLGNGRQAISASWGEHLFAIQPVDALRFFSLGYATAIGNSGSARADVIRRESGAFWQNELQLDARYRLFDRFEAGATYNLLNRYRSPFPEGLVVEQAARVWLGAELPAGPHEVGVTVVQHFVEVSGRSLYPTDVALRYAIPLSRVGLLVAADATNVFLAGDSSVRAVRLWLRLRV